MAMAPWGTVQKLSYSGWMVVDTYFYCLLLRLLFGTEDNLLLASSVLACMANEVRWDWQTATYGAEGAWRGGREYSLQGGMLSCSIYNQFLRSDNLKIGGAQCKLKMLLHVEWPLTKGFPWDGEDMTLFQGNFGNNLEWFPLSTWYSIAESEVRKKLSVLEVWYWA